MVDASDSWNNGLMSSMEYGGLWAMGLICFDVTEPLTRTTQTTCFLCRFVELSSDFGASLL